MIMDRVHHKRFHGIRYAFILTAAAVFLWGIMCGLAPAAESVELKLAHFVSPLHVQHGAILFFMMLLTLIDVLLRKFWSQSILGGLDGRVGNHGDHPARHLSDDDEPGI
jgi:hypothetical protein